MKKFAFKIVIRDEDDDQVSVEMQNLYGTEHKAGEVATPALILMDEIIEFINQRWALSSPREGESVQ